VVRRIPGDNGFERLASRVLKAVVVSQTGVLSSSGTELKIDRAERVLPFG